MELFIHKTHISRWMVYTDNDFAGISDEKKITSGYVLSLGFGTLAWASKNHPIITLLEISPILRGGILSNEYSLQFQIFKYNM